MVLDQILLQNLQLPLQILETVIGVALVSRSHLLHLPYFLLEIAPHILNLSFEVLRHRIELSLEPLHDTLLVQLILTLHLPELCFDYRHSLLNLIV